MKLLFLHNKKKCDDTYFIMEFHVETEDDCMTAIHILQLMLKSMMYDGASQQIHKCIKQIQDKLYAIRNAH